jgi:hypothetical protein
MNLKTIQPAVTTVFMATVLAAAPSDQSIIFSRLEEHDTVQVEFESQGCFNHSIWSLRFERKDGLLVSIHPFSKKKRQPSSVIKLTEDEVKGLDQLLKFYRSNHANGCTTVDSITLTLYRGIKPMRQEKYTDASCSLLDHPDPSGGKRPITFQDLIARTTSNNP